MSIKTCTSCGVNIPKDQGSRICSMCYGDIDHGKDGLYRKWLEDQWEYEQIKQQEEEEEEQDEER